MKEIQEDKTSKNVIRQGENLIYLDNIYTNKEIKIYKFCVDCKRKYPADIIYCPKCHGYLFPLPY